MKQLFAFVVVAIAAVFMMNACQKEVSFEGGGTPSEGLLQSNTSGDCLPKTVNGTYEAGTALVANTNTIQVSVEVTTPGAWTIYSDTVNGVFFRASGIFTSTGMTSVTLRGSGTPATSGDFNFLIRYNGQVCSVSVTFLPAGAGGPATFTLNGTPDPCTGFYTVNGSYGAGLVLNASNTVTISVNVTAIGTYNISAPAVNGYAFSANGAFLNTGIQTVTLNGSGIPGAAGTNTFNLTAGSSTCTFPVTVSGAAVYTVDCSTAIPNGTYEEDVPLVPTTNTVTLTVNVTTAGTYSITTTAVNGMTFTGSGTLAVGTQTITLNGSGTPDNDGDFDITVPGSPSCTFQLVVDPASGGPVTIDWKFTEGIVFQGPFVDAVLESIPIPPPIGGNLSVLAYDGETVTGDTLLFIGLADINNAITAGETYSVSSTTGNSASFYVDKSNGDVIYEADPTLTGVNLVVTVTTHNTTTKFIEGTFSGTVLDAGGNPKNITLGTFRGTYQ